MRFMLTFFADEKEWLAMPEDERGAAIAEIGGWFGRYAGAGKIVDGHRLAPRSRARTVRHGRVRKKDLPMVNDGPFLETKESIGSYAIVDVADEAEALEIAKAWPGGGAVEVRPVAD
jgi:hypothetical protein